MEALRLPTEEEVRVAVREGEETVITLVARLVKVIEVFAARQQALEDQLAKNSRNSGKPVWCKNSIHSQEPKRKAACNNRG